jgi:hypothetical protein
MVETPDKMTSPRRFKLTTKKADLQRIQMVILLWR